MGCSTECRHKALKSRLLIASCVVKRRMEEFVARGVVVLEVGRGAGEGHGVSRRCGVC